LTSFSKAASLRVVLGITSRCAAVGLFATVKPE
jgi:hypothetical protein